MNKDVEVLISIFEQDRQERFVWYHPVYPVHFQHVKYPMG